MLRLNEITDEAKQKRTVILPSGETFILQIDYLPQQYGWIIRELIYEEVTIRNLRIVNSLNLLHQFRNLLPFGIACISDDDIEPYHAENFLLEASKLYVLTEEEVEQYGSFLRGEI